MKLTYTKISVYKLLVLDLVEISRPDFFQIFFIEGYHLNWPAPYYEDTSRFYRMFSERKVFATLNPNSIQLFQQLLKMSYHLDDKKGKLQAYKLANIS